MPRLLLFLAVTGLLSSCSDPTRQPGTISDLAIQNVTVIDAEHGVRTARTVVVRDGRITSVQETGEGVRAADVVDGTGHYLIPGLWDFHVHLTYEPRLTDAMPALFLNYGVTSIRDTGGLLERVAPVVGAMRAEGAIAPRVFFSGPLMDGEFVVYDGSNGSTPLGISNPDPATARANMARLAEAGVDFVKIYEMVTPEVFEVLVEEAGARGLPIDAHVPLSMRARDVGPSIQSLEHLRNIEMDCTATADAAVARRRELLANHDRLTGAALRSQLHRAYRIPSISAYDEEACRKVFGSMMGTIQVPTLRITALALQPPYTRQDWDSLLAKLPEEVAAEWRVVADNDHAAAPRDLTFPYWTLSMTNEMYEAGIPIGAGTDTPIALAAPGYSLHSELEMLVRAGLPPIEALRAATLRPAEFFGLENEMGTIEAGQLADLVLLSGNPLEDITATRSVVAVVTKGQLLTRSELNELVSANH